MTAALRVVLFLLAVSLVAGAVTGQPLYYRLSYLWALLLIGSWIMAWLSLRGIQLRRTARTLRSQVGQVFEERYEIMNTSRLPRLWIEVRDESSLPGSHGSHVLTLIGGREMRTYLARTRLTERGVFPLGPTVLGAGDLFGLFPVQHSFENEDSLLVYPMMVDVRSFPNPPGLLPGGEALRRRTPQVTSNAAGVREYNPGDPLSRIHWLSTARRDRLMVKEFELDPLADVWVFVDGMRGTHFARQVPQKEYEPQDVWRQRTKFELPPSTLEYSVSIAASLARFYLSRSRAVGLVTSGQILRVLASDRGGRQLGKILESLALMHAEGNVPLTGLVEGQARYLPRGSTVVLVTPSPSNDVIQSVDLLARRGLRPVAVLLDASSFGAFYSGESLAESLKALGVSVCQIRFGEDLSNALSETLRSSLQMF
jgi:uncharacterized protein (DUF58 family)